MSVYMLFYASRNRRTTDDEWARAAVTSNARARAAPTERENRTGAGPKYYLQSIRSVT